MGLIKYLRATAPYYKARFRHGEEGAVATEYGFLIVFIAIGVAIGAVVLGQGLLNLFEDTGQTVDGADMGTLPTGPVKGGSTAST